MILTMKFNTFLLCVYFLPGFAEENFEELTNFYIPVLQFMLNEIKIKRIFYIYSDDNVLGDQFIQMMFADEPVEVFKIEDTDKISSLYKGEDINSYIALIDSNFQNKSYKLSPYALNRFQESIIISGSSLLDIDPAAKDASSFVISDKQIYGVVRCNQFRSFVSLVHIAFHDLLDFDLVPLAQCKYEINQLKGDFFLNTKDIPLTVPFEEVPYTGKFNYFYRESLKHFTQKISKYSLNLHNASTLLIDDFFMDSIITKDVLKSDYCLVVPTPNFLPADLYLSYTFKGITWIVILILIFYITFAFMYLFNESFFHGFYFVISASTWTSWFPSFKRLNIRQFLLFAFSISYGFCITRIYFAKLSTFLATDIFVEEIENIQDIIDSGLKIVGNSHNLAKFSKTFFGVARSEHIQERIPGTTSQELYMDLNKSFCYHIQDFRWEYIKKKQNFLYQKKLKTTRICTPDMKWTYMSEIRQIEPFFTNFYAMAKETGMFSIWETLSYIDIGQVGIFKYAQDEKDIEKQLTFIFFMKIWYLLVGGWTLGILCFTFEKGWYYSKDVRKKITFRQIPSLISEGFSFLFERI